MENLRTASAVLATGAVLLLGLSVAGCGSRMAAVGAVSGSGGPAPDGAAISMNGHPKILFNNAQAKARLQALLAADDAFAVRFRDMIDGQLGGANNYGFAPEDAAFLYQVTRTSRYADYAIGLVDKLVTSEEALIQAGKRANVAADSYLGVGATVGSVAKVYDWAYERLTPSQRTRWIAYANQAVWNVWHPDDAVWGNVHHPWTGWSVNNPSNNYYYSFLRATMLLGLATRGENDRAQDWITMFRTTKLQEQLLPYFNANLVGGGSREGTGYGVAMRELFELMWYWEQSTGEVLKTLTLHTQASLLYMIHETAPTLDRIAPIGDHSRDSTAALFEYHRTYEESLAYMFGAAPEAAAARWWLANGSVPKVSHAYEMVKDYIFYDRGRPLAPLTILYPVYFGAGTGQVFMRSGWSRDATYAYFTAGPFTEDHAHEDQGQLGIYKNEWLAIDENLWTHSGIRQEPELHNLVRLAKSGKTVHMRKAENAGVLRALHDTPAYTYVAGDYQQAYDAIALTANVRQVLFLKPNTFVVFDRVETQDATISKIWQLSSTVQPSDVTRVPVVIKGSVSRLAIFPVIAKANSLLTWRSLDSSEYSTGYRFEETDSADGVSLFLNVLSLDGSVNAVSRSDQGGLVGAQLTMANGSTATVRFSVTDTSGTVETRARGGQVNVSATLAVGVDTLPKLAP